MKLQEEYDNQKFLSAHQDRTDEDIARNSNRTQSSMNGLHGSGQNVPFHKSTMTLAEKKRIQWQLEKGACVYLFSLDFKNFTDSKSQKFFFPNLIKSNNKKQKTKSK